MKTVQITLIGDPIRGYELPVLPGDKVHLIKEANNPYDNEAIEVHCMAGEVGAKLAGLEASDNLKRGYVANSVSTKANGTWSAGRLYDKIGDNPTIAKVLFVKEHCVIAEVTI